MSLPNIGNSWDLPLIVIKCRKIEQDIVITKFREVDEAFLKILIINPRYEQLNISNCEPYRFKKASIYGKPWNITLGEKQREPFDIYK